jgi:hypothetical protein
MDRTLYGATLVIALLLIAGSQFIPNSMFMWFASTSLWMDLVRGLIGLLMLGLLITSPPRKLVFRWALGLMGVLASGVAVGLFLDNSIHALDILLCIQAAVAFGVAALELMPEETEPDWQWKPAWQAEPAIAVASPMTTQQPVEPVQATRSPRTGVARLRKPRKARTATAATSRSRASAPRRARRLPALPIAGTSS